MAKPGVILASNGLADDGWTKGTRGLIENLQGRGVGKVLVIEWASIGLSAKDSVQNEVAVSRLLEAGFEVRILDPGDNWGQAVHWADCVYFNGGNPWILNKAFRDAGLFYDHLRFITEHKVVVLCSAAAMVMGSGYLLGEKAAQPVEVVRFQPGDVWGKDLYEYAVIPHLPKWLWPLVALLVGRKIGHYRILIIPNGKFVEL